MKKMMTSAVLAATLCLAVAFGASGNVEKREYVCMMQDMVLTKPGIAIQYQGKTYYGCCAMCKEKIKNEPKKYTRAIDPVSGKQVDKADRKSTRLNSSHRTISYAVFCLKKKKKKKKIYKQQNNTIRNLLTHNKPMLT